MTRNEARAALLRQIDSLPKPQADIARKILPTMDGIEDDGAFVRDTATLRAALQFVEYMATGVRPKTETVQ
ncbi:hypothetical protein [Mesorhizobium sp. M8A.F.Ca.ET.165.01.1.1]|uniref:hypothetical protein n=1 Tax=Mesorhizobium sp. M8A.F.Ca.ET.165.01.1.1 TaxID=2563960 RepID=UPI0010938F8A|nr:hypothetical protein [Mesorhizobium sp. M8A.F.Ca.ET.165.01.1.1]TGT44419.1 hypothetical protein EN808_08675 [Mesorhizobium sp. M8A.F.Ca.ET.165.01.1.1]